MPTSTAQPSSTTTSGIKKLSNGDSIIPASTRPDGTVRKEIRVKPGYKPPEDVEKYKNRTADAWKNRGRGGVPGAEGVEAEPPHKAAANKNAKRREARKKAAAGDDDQVDGGGADRAKTSDTTTNGDAAQVVNVKLEEIDPEVEKAKEARKLAKKLRQARELNDKHQKGDNILPEQFAKVQRITELIRDLDKLGFDAEGEKRVDEEAAG